MLEQQRAVLEAASFADFGAVAAGATTVAGVDQAFVDDEAVVSAAVAVRDGAVVERTYAVEALERPYVPGFLSFREGPAAIAALTRLHDPIDAVLVDGNGRLHPRQAGLATHVGVVLDVPTVGVAKSLLCGRPVEATDGLSAGEAVSVVADDDVDAPPGSAIGAVVQTRRFEGSARRVNPVYVSPGHRVGQTTAVDLLLEQCAGYKLPEPLRAADTYADRVRDSVVQRPKQ